MTTGTTVVRIILGFIGALMLAGGLLLVVMLGPVEGLGAFWLIVIGGVLLIAVVVEASRYRSQAAEQQEAAEQAEEDPGDRDAHAATRRAGVRPRPGR